MDLSSLYNCSIVHPESRMLVFTDPASGALCVKDLVICGKLLVPGQCWAVTCLKLPICLREDFMLMLLSRPQHLSLAKRKPNPDADHRKGSSMIQGLGPGWALFTRSILLIFSISFSISKQLAGDQLLEQKQLELRLRA